MHHAMEFRGRGDFWPRKGNCLRPKEEVPLLTQSASKET